MVPLIPNNYNETKILGLFLLSCDTVGSVYNTGTNEVEVAHKRTDLNIF